AEWEKAARGGLDGHHYPWPSHGRSYSENIDCAKATYGVCNKGGTTPVGNDNHNGYGLYDMAGNVWEWVWDWYDDNWYENLRATDNDTRGPDSGVYRVLRGGGWDDDANDLRCSNRVDSYDYPYFSNYDLGFRAVFSVNLKGAAQRNQRKKRRKKDRFQGMEVINLDTGSNYIGEN
ncbi:MAG: SUMF1/EgtB/PvdO family nonheme iron enzyme, partial [Deltaproteobacteria bacterium]|nr:SUMF1/EgtB/PvdO family nonheme iron enzyme [Deltaproteobacteria bacterium]